MGSITGMVLRRHIFRDRYRGSLGQHAEELEVDRVVAALETRTQPLGQGGQP